LEPPFDPPDFEPPDFEPPLEPFDPEDFVEPREDDFAAVFVVRLVAPAFAPLFAPLFVPRLAPDFALDFEAPPDDDFAADRVAPDLRAPVPRPADFEPVRLPLFALVFVEEVSESPMALPAASFTLLSAD
jgi:hypothetical protein